MTSSASRHRSRSTTPAEDPVEAARTARLHYVNDDAPGIRRVRSGRGFTYRDAEGGPIDDDALARIRALAIPPAWTHVWICADPLGHIQATGRDAKGRKQYRYHPRWRQVRDETKYARMLDFARALPALRRQVEDDLGRPGLPRDKVLAAVVRLLEETRIRVGNEEYARANRSFGLTTLRDRHVAIHGATIRFTFRGKAGQRHVIGLRDPRLARVVQRSRDVPGQRLFQYRAGDGTWQSIDSDDVNEYIRRAMGGDFTAKDFRTWAGTYLALAALRAAEGYRTQAEQKKRVVEAVKEVAEELGNTPAVARASYIHPEVIEAYTEGALASDADDPEQATADRDGARSVAEAVDEETAAAASPPPAGLRPEEAEVVQLLEQRVADGA